MCFVSGKRPSCWWNSVREVLVSEGLGDLAGQVVLDAPEDGEQGEELIELRDKFKKFAGKIYLPKFVIQQGAQWREVSYETDIVSRIDWTQADFTAEKNLQLAARGFTGCGNSCDAGREKRN